MTSTTQVHQNFVNGPMGNKPVTALPGIGVVYGANLNANGYYKASAVYGQYLVADKNKNEFVGWAKNNAGINQGNNGYHANRCYAGLNEWDGQNFV